MVRAVVVRDREVETECDRELDEMIECASSSSSELGMLEFMRESGGRIESAVVVVSTVLARVFLERLQKVKNNQKNLTLTPYANPQTYFGVHKSSCDFHADNAYRWDECNFNHFPQHLQRTRCASTSATFGWCLK